ncbi:diguanylate cyclase [Geothrix oryzae]|uniref:diguanylate cyclase n=1 Tax=Geothrix oryzae TaxID=2927975 RepID=A0ABN6UTL7_9BACT|nr:ABC transporter substrate-binding protein [Geothrix oryzae]BDU68069.1 diguanylate cyclase [Geothrix oryzae]
MTSPPAATPIPAPRQPEAASGLGRIAAKLRWLVLGAGLGCILMAAPPPESITLQLKWRHQFQFAGYYAAQEKGFYREAGLEVTMLEADPSTDPAREVVAGRAQYGVSNSALLLARQQGLPVVALAVIYQHSPLALLARSGAGIHSVHDLAGRRIMIDRHSDELLAFLRKEGVPVSSLSLQEHRFDPSALLNGEVDAISAYSTDEPYFLDQAGFSYLTFTPRAIGLDFYGDNLFTTEEEIRAHPARVKAFREASLRGWAYAMQHPEEVVDLILARYGGRHGRDHLLYEASQMAPLLQRDLVELGYMHPDRWQRMADAYAQLDLLPTGFPLEGFLYDPGAGDRQARRNLRLMLTLALPIGLVLGAAVLVFLWMNRRLARAIRAQAQMSGGLRESERQFRFIAEHSADVIWTMDLPSGRFTYVSPSVVQLRGYTPEEILAMPVAEALTPESAARVQKILIESLAEWHAGATLPPRVVEVDQPHKDGHLVPTEVVTTLHGDAEGRPTRVLGVSRNITARRRAEEQLRRNLETLEQAASTDLLTHAWNRRHFDAAIEGEMHRSLRYGHPLSMLMLDIDHFKRINDTYGHPEGDRVLMEVADQVRAVIRLSDSLTRWGGEEFIVLMPNTGLANAKALAERIRESLAGCAIEGIGPVTASFGVAEYLPDASRESWLERVDHALYRAKQAGRNRVEADPLQSGIEPRGEHPEGTFLKLAWSASFRSGNPLIDAQHERLFRLSNDLLDAVLSGRDDGDLAALVTKLLSEVAQHFQDEEAILADLGFSGLQEHRQKHAELIGKALDLQQAFQAGTLSSGRLFQFLAQDVVALHMLKADREFFHLTAPPQG